MIRPATLDDAHALVELSTQTFTETFGYLYPPEDLEHYLATTYTADAYATMLDDPYHAIWVLEEDDELIGYVLAGPCSLPHEDVTPEDREIKRLYVKKGHQNSGDGQKLMQQAMDWIGDRTTWIGVWSENYGAQRFYERFGFSKIGEYKFIVGETRDDEFIYRKD